MLKGDDILRQFWEVEEKSIPNSTLRPEERIVMNHFRTNHSRTPEGRFVVLLSKQGAADQLGKSRTQAMRRFISFERSLYAKGQFKEFEKVIDK